ncbi:hypothetical protein DCS_07497 [Drechmeria coniospora]|uniref:Dipeptidyl-peptidase V n=1 Tax=Drechmeria coniospora TaxID=98403 RepID=A0A151GEL3_DRECN|nr:hypothetical protein DCS_07497 [Drechmeria coniospora]KYK55534.1 hypothetical protein DCS_07497 [Drechmeria coniospora]
MTIQASNFTPEVLLSAPRRSTAIPNPSGQLALYTVSSYSFDTHCKSSSIRILNIKDGSSEIISDNLGATDPVWLSDEEVLYLQPGENGCTMLMSQHVSDNSKPQVVHHLAGTISSPKVKQISSGRVAICCAAATTPTGEIYWPPAEVKSHSTAKIYTSLFVRHWDTWMTENENSLWYGQLAKKDGRWVLESPGLTNLLADTGLCSPVPFGSGGDFDISADGICFVAKDPSLNLARYTKTDLYYVPIKSFVKKPSVPPQMIKTGDLRGFSTSPTFSNDGRQIAFCRMKHDQYESDKSRLLMIPDVNDLTCFQEFYETADGEGGWDLRPDMITWSHDGKELYVGAEMHGRVKLWKLPSCPRQAKKLPVSIHDDGCVAEAKLLGHGPLLLITTKSRVESSSYSVLDPSSTQKKEISTSSKNGKSFGLFRSQCDDIWYPGSAGYNNHALVTKPSDFDPSKKYPLAFLIHGGPQSAWVDDWSTRWNPAILAQQGYVVVAPNPTGSTGYGQRHTDAIACNWGGTPYRDLVQCFEYLEKKVSYVDTTRAVALGASYGGYMINWIQGHDLGRKFRALVCHDGVFSTQNQWSTEELWFPEHDFGGTLWESRAIYEKWDPSRHVQNWATPQLVIHNELDYRLPVSEGLAMFNVLQARGVPSKLVVFPDENHWVLKPENSLVWHREVIDWINKYSGINDEHNA